MDNGTLKGRDPPVIVSTIHAKGWDPPVIVSTIHSKGRDPPVIVSTIHKYTVKEYTGLGLRWKYSSKNSIQHSKCVPSTQIPGVETHFETRPLPALCTRPAREASLSLEWD